MTGKFKIEKGVPMPAYRGKYPFSEMAVGDSFTVPLAQRNIVLSSAQHWRKRTMNLGWKFSTRTVDDKTARIWRIE